MLGVGSLADYSIASYGKVGTDTHLPVHTGTLTLTGQPLEFSVTGYLDSAALVLTGGDFPHYRIILEPGALTLDAGQFGLVTTTPLTAAALTLTGKPVAFEVSEPLASGELSLLGSDLDFFTTLPVSRGTLVLDPQPHEFGTTLHVEPASLWLVGGDMPVYRIRLDPGQLYFDGQQFPLAPQFRVEPGALSLFGREIALYPIGGGGSDRKRRPGKANVRTIDRKIEVDDDGKPRKVSLLKRFAPPPPPPPLRLAPIEQPLPPELLEPLDLPVPPIPDMEGVSAEISEAQDVADALAALAALPNPIIDLIDTMDALAALNDTPDPVRDMLMQALAQARSELANAD